MAVVDYTPEIRTDNYVRLTGNGKIGIDVIGNRAMFNSRSNSEDDESKLRHSAGYLSSYLEGEVLEQMTGIRSVSTAEVFSQAAEQNIEILHISKANLNELKNREYFLMLLSDNLKKYRNGNLFKSYKDIRK